MPLTFFWSVSFVLLEVVVVVLSLVGWLGFVFGSGFRGLDCPLVENRSYFTRLPLFVLTGSHWLTSLLCRRVLDVR